MTAAVQRWRDRRPDPRILVGLPYSTRGALLDATHALGAPILISAGSCYREGKGLLPPGDAAWIAYGASLDSAGFTAMLQGGYRWSVGHRCRRCPRHAAGRPENPCRV